MRCYVAVVILALWWHQRVMICLNIRLFKNKICYLFFVMSQCGGSGMFIPDPNFFHPGSWIRTASIPDPGSSSKHLSILTPKKAKKWFLSSKKYDPGCSFRIPDPDADFLPSRIQGSKRHPIPDPGPGSATL
jgi:hypothetical protein